MRIEVQLFEGVATPEGETSIVEGDKIRTTLGPVESDDFTKVFEITLEADGFSLGDVVEPLKVVSVLSSDQQLFSGSGILEPFLKISLREVK